MALIELMPKSEIESSESSIAANFLKSTLRSLFSSSSPAVRESENDLKLKHISLEEVLYHDSSEDCWIIIYDRVYDVTDFLHQIVCIRAAYRNLKITDFWKCLGYKKITWCRSWNQFDNIVEQFEETEKLRCVHPGGFDVLLENAGRDCTQAFRGHSNDAVLSMKQFEIGILPPQQRIYRFPGMIRISDSKPE